MKSKDIVMAEIHSNLELLQENSTEDNDISDIALARETLRAIARKPNKRGATAGIGASLGLLRLVQMQADMPSYIMDGVIDVTIEDERKQLKEKSPADLAREYDELIKGA